MGGSFLFEAASRRYIHLAANDGFNASFDNAPVKIHCTEKIAMIGYCNSRHPVQFSLFDELFYPYCTVKEAVFCVQMERYIIGM